MVKLFCTLSSITRGIIPRLKISLQGGPKSQPLPSCPIIVLRPVNYDRRLIKLDRN